MKTSVGNMKQIKNRIQKQRKARTKKKMKKMQNMNKRAD